MSLVKNVFGPVLRTASYLNSYVGSLCLRLVPEAEGLIILNFHAVVPDAKEWNSKTLNPRYVVSVGEFEQIVDYYLGHGFQAVTPSDILKGLRPKRRYIMFTFDDGYANNLRVVPVLEKHCVPAVFALATEYVLHQKPFWWDIIYQQRIALQGCPWAIDSEVDSLLRETPSAIEKCLIHQFGAAALTVSDESSRPMRVQEIRDLANHPLVCWANHTARHEYLPNCDPDGIRCAVGQAQDALQELTGSIPVSIAYPYGAHNRVVRRICRDLGLQLGFTMASHKQPLNLDTDSDQVMSLPRFAVVHGDCVENQCRATRIDWKPSWFLRGHPANRARCERLSQN